MITIQNLSMHFTGEDLFSNITFLIREKDRIGLVGKNGAGKTTLLKLICQTEQPHSGDVIVPEEVSIGYLPQEKELASNQTVLEEALLAFEEVNQMEDQIVMIQQELELNKDYESKAYHKLLERLSFLNERLALFGAHSREGDAEQILTGLGFEHEDMQRKMPEFSNGWQMRVELAKILLKRPSLLLLDEPTNHLDIESIQWLELFLQSYYGAVMLVSHDRAFLDNVSNRTIEISKGKIYDYKGSYSNYVERRSQRIETQSAAFENQQKEMKEIERFIERFRYKASKAKQVQSRVKLLDKMDEIVVDELDMKGIHFKFPPAPHSGKITLETKGLCKSYGQLEVIKDLDLTIPRGDRIAFVGRNGEGKSTLAKIIAGVLSYEGEFRLGHQVQVGYYAQNQHDMLDMDKTVFQTLDDVATGDIRLRLKAILGAFMFSGDAVDKKVKVLSGGEKARLSLAKMLLKPTNLLILDEPTNHLDMQSKDILKSALLQFEGTLIIVSHDRDFLQGLTTHVFEFRKPVIKSYIGDIYDFLKARELVQLKDIEQREMSLASSKSDSEGSTNKQNWDRKKQMEKDKRRVEKEIENIESQINAIEENIAKCDNQLADPEKHTEGLFTTLWYSEYNAQKQKLTLLMEQWEEKHCQWEVADAEIKAFLGE